MDGSTDNVKLVIVCTLAPEDAAEEFANVCAVAEECMVIDKADWKTEDGVIVFQGTALSALSTITARLYSNSSTKDRVRSISYQDYTRRT